MPKKTTKKPEKEKENPVVVTITAEDAAIFDQKIEVKPGEVAEQLGCSQRTIYNLIQQGYLNFSSKGKVYLTEALVAFYKYKDDKRRQEQESPLDELERELLQEKILKARHEAELKRLEVEKLKGELIEVEQVERQWMVNVLAVQRQLLAAAGKYTPDIYGAATLVAAQQKFSEAMHEILDEFSQTQPEPNSGNGGEQPEPDEVDD